MVLQKQLQSFELMKPGDEKWLLRLQKSLAKMSLLIIGFVLLFKTGAEPLYELISLRY